MTIKIDRSHVCKLMIACSSLYNSLISEALDPDTSIERKEKAYSSADMWERIHDELKEQLDAFDKKEAERMAKFSISDIYAIMNAVYHVAAETMDKNARLYLIGLAKEMDRLADEMEAVEKESVTDDIE